MDAEVEDLIDRLRGEIIVVERRAERAEARVKELEYIFNECGCESADVAFGRKIIE